MLASKFRKLANRSKEVFYNSPEYKRDETYIKSILEDIEEKSNKGYMRTEYKIHDQSWNSSTPEYVNAIINALLLEGFNVTLEVGEDYSTFYITVQWN